MTAPGIVHSRRAGAGRDPARDDGGLRRLAHGDPRRFGALAFGLARPRSSTCSRPDADPEEVEVDAGVGRGKVGAGVTGEGHRARDHRLHRQRSRHRYAIRVRREAIRDLSIEGRMTVCNMAIEAGARAGFVGVDEKTIAYVKGRPYAPTGALWDQAVAYCARCLSDDGAVFDPGGAARCHRDPAAGDLGYLAGDGRAGRRRDPRPRRSRPTRSRPMALRRALAYHGPGGRHADPRYPGRQGVHRLLHQLAHRGPARRGGGREGRKVAPSITLAMVVPGRDS